MSPISETHTIGTETYFFLSSVVRLPLMMLFAHLLPLFFILTPGPTLDPILEVLQSMVLGFIILTLLGEVDKIRLKNISLSDNMITKIDSAKTKLNYQGNANIRIVNTHRQVLVVLHLPTESIIVISPSVLKDLEDNGKISETVIAACLSQTHWTRRFGEILLILAGVVFYSHFFGFGIFSGNYSLWSSLVLAVLALIGIFLLLTYRRSISKIEMVYGEHAHVTPHLLLTGADASVLEVMDNPNDDSRPKPPLKRFIAVSIAAGLIIALVFFIPLYNLTLNSGNVPNEMFMQLVLITIVVAVAFPIMAFMLLIMTYMLIKMGTRENEHANRAATEGSVPHEVNQGIRAILGIDNLTAHWLDNETGERYISVISTKRNGSNKHYFNVHPNLVEYLEYPNEMVCYVISRIMEKRFYKKAQILYGVAIIPFIAFELAGFLVAITNLDEIFNFFAYLVLGTFVCIPLYLVVYIWYRKKRATNDLDLYKQRPEFLTVLRKLVSEKYSPAVQSESYEKRLRRLEQNLQRFRVN